MALMDTALKWGLDRTRIMAIALSFVVVLAMALAFVFRLF